jgi:hypothetical protein
MSQSLQILSRDMFNLAQLFSVITIILGQCYIRVKPKLCALILTIYVHVTGFTAIIGVKIEAIRAKTEGSRHSLSLVTNYTLPVMTVISTAAEQNALQPRSGAKPVGCNTPWPARRPSHRMKQGADGTLPIILKSSGTQAGLSHWCLGSPPDPSCNLVSGHDDFFTGGAYGDPD